MHVITYLELQFSIYTKINIEEFNLLDLVIIKSYDMT